VSCAYEYEVRERERLCRGAKQRRCKDHVPASWNLWDEFCDEREFASRIVVSGDVN